MQPFVAWQSMPAAVSESVELFGIAEFQPGLIPHPISKADFESAMLERSENSKGQCRQVPRLRRRHRAIEGDNQ